MLESYYIYVDSVYDFNILIPMSNTTTRLIANGPTRSRKKVNYVTAEKKFMSINVVLDVKAAGALK